MCGNLCCRPLSIARSNSGVPTVLAGDFNVMPTALDVYAPERWLDDALVPKSEKHSDV